MGESSSESASSIMNLPLVDIDMPPLRRKESSIEDRAISDKDTPIEELLKRLRLLVSSRPTDSMSSHLPVPLQKEVNNIITEGKANLHQPVGKPGQNEVAATRSQMKLSYVEAAELNNKRKKPTVLLYPSKENDKEIEEILTEELKVDSTTFRLKNVRKIQNK
ncbi:hypothetical protein AVEN_168633-1 [Araneus ventricosus]|uniref:Uncharacterized protein n=1 Tax=Araneus ventricosus TaxID=182803 RepID=A0A4Y2JAS2_ARAVE|nr:hypothetical protein AVEN_168633-1 [Araneus ventricosus]